MELNKTTLSECGEKGFFVYENIEHWCWNICKHIWHLGCNCSSTSLVQRSYTVYWHNWV